MCPTLPSIIYGVVKSRPEDDCPVHLCCELVRVEMWVEIRRSPWQQRIGKSRSSANLGGAPKSTILLLGDIPSHESGSSEQPRVLPSSNVP